MSMKNSGRRRWAGTSPARISTAGELVELTTTSTSPSAPAIAERPRRCRVVGGAHLAEDLALARHERVEPGRDAEEVERRRLVVQPVDERRERLTRHLLERGDGAVDALVGQVELGAVAGRE